MTPNRDKELNNMDPQIDHFVGDKVIHWEKDSFFNKECWAHYRST